MIEPPELWDGVLGRLRHEIPGFQVEAWLCPLVPRLDENALRLWCPSAFHRDRVTRYLEPIRRCVAAQAGRPLQVELSLGEQPATASPASPTPDSPEPDRVAAATARPAPPGIQPPLPYSFDTFVVGPCNALAKEASLALARGSQLGAPLFLCSSAGLGKTHLARSVAREARERGVQGTVYASAESFTSQLMTSIRSRSTDGFKRRFRRDCDLLILEDVQFLAGKTATQLELFHTVEHLRAAGRPIVMTADRVPGQFAEFEPRMVSLLSSGLVAELEPPDAQIRRRILKSKAAAGGVRIPEDCLDRMVETLRGSVRDLEGVLTQLVASSVLLKRPIDAELTEQALRKVEPGGRGRPLEPTAVVQTVATFFGTTPAKLAAKTRRRDVLLPRKLAMYLCFRYTDASIAEIGRALGREHTSVRNAIAFVERGILERAPLRYQLEELTARL
jgi:chromosomal replication initiator protein